MGNCAKLTSRDPFDCTPPCHSELVALLVLAPKARVKRVESRRVFAQDDSARSVLQHTFLFHRKLLKINLAVLHYLNVRKAWIGEQLRVGVAHFFKNLRYDRSPTCCNCDPYGKEDIFPKRLRNHGAFPHLLTQKQISDWAGNRWRIALPQIPTV